MSTKPTKTTTDPLIEGAKLHFTAATEHIRKGCAEALITGLHLFALHHRASTGHGGDRQSFKFSRENLKKGFLEELTEIGIPTPTAYRWMNACGNALLRATVIMDSEDLAENLPEAGSAKWTAWEKALAEVAQGMSLNRLLIGTTKASTEEHRYDELLSADEEGRERATTLLQGVAEGKYTLVQAVRALGSLEAYDELRKGGGEKVRKDPVYLTMDGATGHLDGLFVKSLTTLRNTFAHWEETPAPARKKARELWLTVIDAMPADLKNG